MEIPKTPLWQTLLLESPWPLLAALAFIAMAMVVLARRCDQIERRPAAKRWRLAGVLVLLSAVGVAVAAHVIVTDREAVKQATAELVDATAPLDLTQLRGLLSEQVRLTDPQGKVVLEGDALSGALDTVISRDPIASHRMATLEAGVEQRGGFTIARSRMDLVTRLNESSIGGSGPQPSTWIVEWEPQADGTWKVRELRCVSFQLGDPSALLSLLRAGWRFG